MTGRTLRTLSSLVIAWVAGWLLPGAASAQDGIACPDAPALEQNYGCNLFWHAPGVTWQYGCNQTVFADDLGCAPDWYAMGEVMPLFRDTRDINFATLGAGGPTVLSTNDMNDEFQTGARVLVGRTLSDWYRVEGSAYGQYTWSGAAAISNAANSLTSPFDATTVPVDFTVDGNTTAAISFTSKLSNFELNVRRRIPVIPGPFTASFLFGGRFMQLDETFNYAGAGPVQTNLVGVATKNSMAGLQIGATAQYMARPRWFIDFDIKGAMFANSASQNTTYTNSANGAFASAANADQTAYALDMSLMVNWHCTRSITVRAGYYANFMGGVALGPNNFQNDLGVLTSGIGLLDHSGEIFFHGPVAGIVGVW